MAARNGAALARRTPPIKRNGHMATAMAAIDENSSTRQNTSESISQGFAHTHFAPVEDA